MYYYSPRTAVLMSSFNTEGILVTAPPHRAAQYIPSYRIEDDVRMVIMCRSYYVKPLREP